MAPRNRYLCHFALPFCLAIAAPQQRGCSRRGASNHGTVNKMETKPRIMAAIAACGCFGANETTEEPGRRLLGAALAAPRDAEGGGSRGLIC